MASQRSAAVNKDVLTQIDNLFVLRTTAPQDRDAIKAWIDIHADSKTILAELPTLQTGECWLWQPERGEPIKFRFRRRHTFDAGTTPRVGEVATPPVRTTLADVDLDAIAAAITPHRERSGDDTTPLHAENARLRRELAAAAAAPARETIIEIPVPTPVDPATIDTLRRAIADLTAVVDQLANPTTPAPTPAPATRAARTAPTTKEKNPSTADRPTMSRSDGDAPALRSGAQRMVLALGRMAPLRLTKSQWGTVARLRTSGGTWSTYLSDIRRAGLLDETPAGYTLTDVGFDYLGGRPDPLSPRELQDHYRAVLRRGAATMLDALIDAYPRSLTKEELGAAAEITTTGGTFSTYLSDLTRNGLARKTATGIIATDILIHGSQLDQTSSPSV